MNSYTYRCASRAALALALALGGAWTHAQEPAHQEAQYITGGVGAEEREDMKAQREQYNLLLTFADRNGEMQAGVAVTLPPGSYRISASVDGRQQVRSANLGHGPREVAFHWAPEMASAR
eukprot:gene28655-35550_t